MDYARREFLLTFRRIVAGVLLVTLLVAFWADRPLAAASLPKPPTGKLLRELDPASANAVLKEPTPTPVISLLRRPWLAFYQIMGAPSLNHGALSEEEESQFRVAVGCLAGFFFAVGILLWNRGQRLINEARKAT